MSCSKTWTGWGSAPIHAMPSVAAAADSAAATMRCRTSPVRPAERNCRGVSCPVGRCSSMAFGPSVRLTAVF